jgi:hypothetical protein
MNFAMIWVICCIFRDKVAAFYWKLLPLIWPCCSIAIRSGSCVFVRYLYDGKLYGAWIPQNRERMATLHCLPSFWMKLLGRWQYRTSVARIANGKISFNYSIPGSSSVYQASLEYRANKVKDMSLQPEWLCLDPSGSGEYVRWSQQPGIECEIEAGQITGGVIMVGNEVYRGAVSPSFGPSGTSLLDEE